MSRKVMGFVLLLCVGMVLVDFLFVVFVEDVDVVFEVLVMVLFLGVVLWEIFCIYCLKMNIYVMYFYWFDNWEDIGYQYEGMFGFILVVLFENSVLICNCVGFYFWNYFILVDFDCEVVMGGVVLLGDWYIGYIFMVQVFGFVFLY